MRSDELAGLLQHQNLDPSNPSAIAVSLEDGDLFARQLAVEALSRSGASGVEGLARALGDQQPIAVRIAAASGLSRSGANAAGAMPELGRCLEADDEMLRWHAAFALSRIGTAALPLLMTTLASNNPVVQCAALNAISWMGAGAASVVETIRRFVSAEAYSLRFAACGALMRITGESSNGLPALLAALDDPREAVRQDAVQRIGEGGPVASSSAPQLLRSLADPSFQVRAAAALALARIDARDASVVQDLANLLQDPDSETRAAAGIALSALGPDAASALPQLRALQNGSDPRLAAIASAAVERIAPSTV